MLKHLTILCLSCLLWLGMGSPINLNPIPENEAVAATVSSEVETAVDSFLRQIPQGYYTVKEVDEIENLVKKKDAQLIDVREPLEYASGHILNAINIPLRDLAKKQDKIATDRPVILYCTVGYRTAIGLSTLHLLGYDNVLGYPPSVKGWKAAGKSLNY
ncbi:MAG: rhodanese-like domain-containing protein [Halothece sp. Uz-M2-17]|nr:rhodanese-like domain-containing protein [Halothece sp. Uz-M2-17]